MATSIYSYEVRDLITNAALCNLPLTGVKYSKILNDSGQAGGSFKVENTRRMVPDPYDATMPGRRCLYIYRDEVPMWGGIIWTRKYDSRTGSVTIGAGDWWSYFDHRKVISLLTFPINPAFDIAQKSLTYATTEQNQIARNLVALAQSHAGGDLGIQFDTSTSLINRDRTYRGYELPDVGQALRQLASVIDGPDMMFDTAGPDSQGRPIRRFIQGDPHLGQEGSPWVWEAGGNLVDYQWNTDASRYASRAYSFGEGTVEGTRIAVSEDASRYARGYPLMELEANYSTVSDSGTLQAHADADQFGARLPVALPVLTVRGDRSPRVGEWGMGDDAQIIIQDNFFPNGIDTSMRIVKAEITPGEEEEQVLLTVAPVLDDVA